MWDSFIKLFTEMPVVAYVLFGVGAVLCIIEIFIPGFGVFGGVGITLVLVGIIMRMLSGGDAWMLLYMILICAALFCLGFFVLSKVATKGRLSKSGIFSVPDSLPTGHTEGTKDFSFLLGQVGVSQTTLRPIGVGKFQDTIVDVVCKGEMIVAGEQIKVIYVEGQRIEVVKA
ncbi:MAG: NfeD family protein [Clostridia bacterium]